MTAGDALWRIFKWVAAAFVTLFMLACAAPFVPIVLERIF